MNSYFRYIALPFMALALIGLTLSLIAHFLALFGQTLPIENLAWGLHIGIFVVWLPTVLISTRMMRGASQKDFWKIALRGCPPWMRYAAYGLFGYAILNFVIFMATSTHQKNQTSSEPPPAEIIRGVSGHWMIFYSVSFCVLYSAYRQGWNGMRQTCPNGHEVSLVSKFCDQCGAEIHKSESPKLQQ